MNGLSRKLTGIKADILIFFDKVIVYQILLLKKIVKNHKDKLALSMYFTLP